MKLYKSCVYLIAASLSHYGFASDYQNYRLGQYDEAFNLLNNKAAQDPVADYYLGRIYLYGYGQLKNKKLALRYFQQSAEKGYVPAQLLLGRYYFAVKKDPELAYKWFKRAADRDDLSAKMYVAAAYLYGYGVGKNADRARIYYIDAAKAGNSIAQYQLGDYFFSSRSSSNKRLGIIWLNKAATEGNNPRAQTLLAEIYAEGKYTRPDLFTAQELLDKAVAQHYQPAMIVFGDLALKKDEVETAKRWYEKAAKLNNPQAQFKLANLYLNEKISFHDFKQGFEWMLKAAQGNDVQAQKQLAALYEKGIGTEANPKESEQWLKKAEQTAKAESSSRAMLERWLTDGGVAPKGLAQYQSGGIFNAWTNKSALRDTLYNQSPRLQTIPKSVLFKPDFALAQPNEVPLNEYYDAFVTVNQGMEDNQFTYPLYPLSQHLQAQVQANSYVRRLHEDSLPYSDVYSLPSSPDEQEEIEYGSWNEGMKDEMNYIAIFNDLYSRAILGDSKAQFHVGQMFEYGLGVMKNEQMAITFYGKAADQQNIPAQYSMAVLYLKRTDDPESYSKGADWLRDAAFKGNAYAQYVMAHLLRDKKGGQQLVTPDREQALSMLYLSAGSGFGPAEYELAELLTHDKDADLNVVMRNKRRHLVRSLYEGAAAQGVTQALVPFAFFNAMDSHPKAQKEAFEIAKVQADADKPGAALLLGLLYDRGIGVKADLDEAVKWYKKAANNRVSQFIIGTYTYQGKGFYEDEDEGIELLKQSAEGGFSYADLNLAVVAHKDKKDFLPLLNKAYRAGNSRAGILLADYTLAQDNSVENLQQAKMIFQNLAEKGDQYAQLKLAYMFDKGFGSERNESEAYRWYMASAQQGNPIAQYQLGQMYQLGYAGQPDVQQAIDWYQKAAAVLPQANVAIGFLEETVADNYKLALQAYQKAAEQGDLFGQYNLALMYEYGKGTEVNYEKARHYYNEAIKQGLPQAMAQLAGLDFYGLGAERDTDKAIELYTKAAEKGNDAALYQLGLLSETGVGLDLDYEQAHKYYKGAADKGNEKAMIALARMYQYGLGIDKNNQKAMEIYQALAKRNNAYAQYQLGTFYLEGLVGERMPDKGKQWLESASRNGSEQAKKALESMAARAQERVSYIEPVMLKKFPAIVEQSADLIYLSALNEWNSGEEIVSRMMFHHLLNKYPDYQPAKRAYEQIKRSLNSSFYG